MKKFPEWVLKHKKKGIELREIRGRYYVYEVSSKWNKDLKRSQKITGSYLGTITEANGFVPKRTKQVKISKMNKKAKPTLSVKEWGVSNFIQENMTRYIELLQKHFPTIWQSIIALSYGRFTESSPMKNMKFHYQNSFISELYPDAKISKNSISKILLELGKDRESIVNFFKEFNTEDDKIIFDGTDLVSNSRKMDYPKLSKTKKGGFDFAINIMFVFSVKSQLPIYYRTLPGNIKDVKAFKLSLLESNINDALIVLDKGFYSETNIQKLEDENLDFIISLRRSSTLIDYTCFETAAKDSLGGFFKYDGKIIWYQTSESEKGLVHTFLSDELKTEESKDYLNRIETHPEKYSIEGFHQNVKKFGTLSILSNTNNKAETIYGFYKNRNQVELMIDAFKNLISADSSYMQNEFSLEAWMFINYIALHWYYIMLNKLKSSKLNNKFSPSDLIKFLKEVKKVKLNKKWYDAEITASTSDITNKLNMPVT
jgi:hypothetical protein